MVDAEAETSHEHSSPTVSWFELFYDLVVIAAVAVTNDVFLENPSINDAIAAIVGFIGLSWVWFLTTLFNNIHPGNDVPRRLLLLLQMGLIITGTLTFGQADEEGAHVAMLAYAGALLTIPLLLLNDRLVNRSAAHLPWRRTVALPLVVAAAVSVVGAFCPPSVSPWFFIVVLLISTIPVLTYYYPGWQQDPRLRPDHLRERLGLFVLIVLGEGFMQLVRSLHDLDSIPRAGLYSLTFLVSFALWWVYFEGTFTESLDLSRIRWRLTLLGHLALVIGMAGTLDILVLLTARKEEIIGSLIMDYFTWCIGGVLVAFAILRVAAHGRLGAAGLLHLASAVGLVLLGVAYGDVGMSHFYLIVGVCAATIIVNGIAAAWLDLGSHRDARTKGSVLIRGVPER